MATRRMTRRSLAGASDENGPSATLSTSTVAQSTAAAMVKPAAAAAGKSTVGQRAAPKSKIAVESTNQAKKRNALGDVTNAAKTRTVNVGGSKPAAAAGTKPVRRAPIRTRSSTDGTQAPLDANTEQDEDAKDAMVVDEKSSTSRPIKSLRSSAQGSTATSTTANNKAADAPTNKATSRAGGSRALSSKSGNAPAASASTAAAAANKRARELRLKAAEAAAAAAQAELEAARAEEEEHAAKRRRTSEPELITEDDEEEEEDEIEAEVLGQSAKDAGWEDLDAGDEEDPLMVSTYVNEIYDYMRKLELTTIPDKHYMERQDELTWKMRGILVDWLIDVHTKFRLLPETIFLASNIIDRFLTARVVSLVKFQLVGVTALLVAAKYEEVICPGIQNFLYMTDGGYDDDEILKAERYLLAQIEFNLSYPNPINFLRRISKADGYDIQSRTFAKFLMEISVVDRRFLDKPPSLIAAGASWLARKVLNRGPWSANLVHYSGYSEEELLETAQMMLDYVVRNSGLSKGTVYVRDGVLHQGNVQPEHPNFFKKYSAKKFMKAATFIRNWVEEMYAPTYSRAYSAKTSGVALTFHLEEWELYPGEPASPASE